MNLVTNSSKLLIKVLKIKNIYLLRSYVILSQLNNLRSK